MVQSPPAAGDQAVAAVFLLIVASAILFFVSVHVTGRFARRLQISDIRDTDALLATIYRSLCTSVLVGTYVALPALPFPIIVAIAGLVAPIAILKRIYATDLRTAAKLWLFVFTAEVMAGAVLVIGATWFGGYLDLRFQLPALLEAAG